ncbi:DUF481 domain-containing protein [Marinimicrobium sp. ARAG 43.8]|uniref:DUF481 domain-containing protein n=1 Tax=Marinimicrobium sp. ARAG 43.8 TaxID=3418719 RepID=UPI003CF3A0A3
MPFSQYASYWRLALSVLSLVALPASAGMLELQNGDRIAGEFVRADENSVIWQSESLGQLTIDKTKIYDLQTSKPLKINGVGEPCTVNGMDQEHLVYSCGDDVIPRRVPLVSLAMIIPYQQFRTGESRTLTGRVNMSGTYARGNEVKDDWRVVSSVEYRRVDWRHSGSFEYASYSSGQDEPDVRWGGRYVLDWFFRERWFLNSDARFGRDETRSVDRYYNIGTGTGYQFWENATTALAMTSGLVLVSDTYEVPASPGPDFVRQEERVSWRVSTDFRYKLPLGVSLFHRNEYVRSFEEARDWYLTTTTGFNTMIASRLYSEVKLDYQVDNDPQPDTEREDVRLVVGLTYEW